MPDHTTTDDLQRAVNAWKSAPRGDASLTPAGRDRVLRGALESSSWVEKSLASLFFPRTWLVTAGVLPALLVAVVSVVALRPGAGVDPADANVLVTKVGDQVVFRIENGGMPHTVTKSSSPVDFDSADAVKVRNGAFVDRAEDDTNLVFYKID